MRRAACSVALVAVMATPALAAPPTGFRESAPLSVRVAKISGVPEAKVYCARNYAAWREHLASTNHDSDANAYTRLSVRAVYVASNVCVWPERWLRGRPTNLYGLAESILTLAHESAHLRGIRDEAEATCWAMRRVATIARVHFGVRKALPRIVEFARIQHALAPPPYNTPCP